jgi:choline dehydrogenase-like flavoprotein
MTQDDAMGWSCFGDRWGNKQTGLFTYLADAAKSGNCSFIDACEVMRVTCENNGSERKKATGVVARVLKKSGDANARCKGVKQYTNLVVKAKHAVVVASGSLHSPCVLLRSSIGRENAHVGKHLTLHPVTAAVSQCLIQHDMGFATPPPHFFSSFFLHIPMIFHESFSSSSHDSLPRLACLSTKMSKCTAKHQ